MDRWISLVALVAVLVLIGWRLPGRNLLLAAAAALALAALVVSLDRAGIWPGAWR